MVYHYTNFIVETNGWWLRRVRPIWMAWGLIGAYFLFDRYYFFGKHATQAYRATPEEVWEQRGKDNKRRWGYKSVYRPTLERSRKKQILEAMGKDYDYGIEYSNRMMLITNKTVDEIIEEENQY